MTAPGSSQHPTAGTLLTNELATELARRALANIAREYPNHPQYLLESDTDAQPPRALHPVFFGCFDWHSAVHTHWLLLRLLTTMPSLSAHSAIAAALEGAFVPAKIRVEADYLLRRPSFERPYGLAWLLLLTAEAAGTPWATPLAPLATAGRTNILRWLGGLRYAVRSGTHNQTAFALTLLHDAAAATGDDELLAASVERAHTLFGNDSGAPLHLEPSGEDFLSPSLMEADLLRRLLPAVDFAAWLTRWLPALPTHADATWVPCGEVDDESDGKGVHLHGLNLSRAWNLDNIAGALPPGDRRIAPLMAAAARHRDAGLRATLAGQSYAGDHWLPSFAVYLLTGRSCDHDQARIHH